MAAFIGSSGRSVKILTRFTLPDGSLPDGERQIGLFHAHAYRRAAIFYGEQLQQPVTPTSASPLKGVRYTFDPELYYNPDAIAIRIPQPQLEPGEEGLWLSATEMLLDMQKRSSIHLSRTNMNTFARILMKNEIAKRHTMRGNLWHVIKV